MKKPKSVLVVLDKPKHEQAALAEAIRLQASSGARLRLVSFAWQAMAEDKAVFDAAQRRALKAEIIRAREVWLRQLVVRSGLVAGDVSIEVVWTDDISGWIRQAQGDTASDAQAADLVIKSVHRTDTLLHTPLDWQLIRECEKPLLLVGGARRGGRRRKSAKGAADVLATVDLRSGDRKHRTLNRRVLDAGAQFAELRGGKLHCVAVIEFSEVLSDLEVIQPRKVVKAALEETSELLAEMIEPYGIARSRVHRPAGKVGHMVAATARKTGAGLVVVGSAARRGVTARLLGNSAEKILARSPADLLIVHP